MSFGDQFNDISYNSNAEVLNTLRDRLTALTALKNQTDDYFQSFIALDSDNPSDRFFSDSFSSIFDNEPMYDDFNPGTGSETSSFLNLSAENSFQAEQGEIKLNRAVSKARKAPSKQKRQAWSPEEDVQLRALYAEYSGKWSKIASRMRNRTERQIRDRYVNVIRSDITKTKWTMDEDTKLMALCKKYKKRWCEIAEYLPGRSEHQVKNRYYHIIKKKLYQDSNPSQLFPFENDASEMHQVQETDPPITDKFEFFDILGDESLTENQRNQDQEGVMKQSKKIQKESISPNSESNAVSNPRRPKRQVWSSEEDEQVRALYVKYGERWNLIAAHLNTGKIGKQIRDRYINKLRPDISHAEWTEEEDRQLIELYKTCGPRWSKITRYLTHRSEHQVKNRYNKISTIIENEMVPLAENYFEDSFKLRTPS